MTPLDHALYALAWASFAVPHSMLASDRAKAALGRAFGRGYRLAYNIYALVHLAAVWLIGRLLLAADAAPFDRPTPIFILQLGLIAMGALVLLMALRGYDGGRFAGVTQLKDSAADEDEPLRIGALNRHIRHPLYAGAILLLVGLATDPFSAATALWASLYFIIGAKFEERRLHDRYGQAYADYVARTPMLFPRLKK